MMDTDDGLCDRCELVPRTDDIDDDLCDGCRQVHYYDALSDLEHELHLARQRAYENVNVWNWCTEMIQSVNAKAVA